MNMVDFAKHELDIILSTIDDPRERDYQKLFNKQVMDIIELFSSQGHTGSTSEEIISILARLLRGRPLTYLTGAEDEWETEGVDDIYLNKRCPAVSRLGNDNSTAKCREAKIFSEDGGLSWFTNRESSIPVVFPFYVPDSPEYVYFDSDGNEITEKEAEELRRNIEDSRYFVAKEGRAFP